MSKLKTGIKAILFEQNILFAKLIERTGFMLDDSLYLKAIFRLIMGYSLNLDDPKTFSEKLQWLKLHDRNTLYTSLVDKYEVKNIIGREIGKDHIIPTLGIWDSVDDINFDSLPNQFVLKTTQGGGSMGVVICKDKSKLDRQVCIADLRKGMKQNIYKSFREWPYKGVKPRIMAEELMTQEDGSPLADYKFFCFNGEPKYVYLRHEEHGETKPRLSFMTMDWEIAPFHNPNYPQFETTPPMPVLFNEMKIMAKKMSKGHAFLRVDLYVINGRIYFSELTFFPGSGMMILEPQEWDKKLGDMIDLRGIKQ